MIWYTGCILFCIQSSTTLRTCFRPLNEPIAATVFPCSFKRKMRQSKNGTNWNRKYIRQEWLYWLIRLDGRILTTMYLNKNIASCQYFKCLHYNVTVRDTPKKNSKEHTTYHVERIKLELVANVHQTRDQTFFSCCWQKNEGEAWYHISDHYTHL